MVSYYLQAQEFFNAGRRAINCIYSTCLITIETNIAVHYHYDHGFSTGETPAPTMTPDNNNHNNTLIRDFMSHSHWRPSRPISSAPTQAVVVVVVVAAKPLHRCLRQSVARWRTYSIRQRVPPSYRPMPTPTCLPHS